MTLKMAAVTNQPNVGFVASGLAALLWYYANQFLATSKIELNRSTTLKFAVLFVLCIFLAAFFASQANSQTILHRDGVQIDLELMGGVVDPLLASSEKMTLILDMHMIADRAGRDHLASGETEESAAAWQKRANSNPLFYNDLKSQLMLKWMIPRMFLLNKHLQNLDVNVLVITPEHAEVQTHLIYSISCDRSSLYIHEPLNNLPYLHYTPWYFAEFKKEAH